MNKKIWLFVGIGILVLTLATAAWYFIIGGNLIVEVTSIGDTQQLIIPFNNILLNTTNDSAIGESSINFVYNREGNFNVSITKTFGDLSGGECSNGVDDCTFEAIITDGINPHYVIDDGDIIIIPLNYNRKYINATLECVAYSCPQTLDVSIRLVEV